MFQWILAFHIIFMVAWFAGLFYLPRLFVYHAMSEDTLSVARFKIMERKLYFFIMTPAALLTILFGIWLVLLMPPHLFHQIWFDLKLFLVALLIIYHLYCGYLLKRFANDRNTHSAVFYRWFNELPTILLILIVILAIVEPKF